MEMIEIGVKVDNSSALVAMGQVDNKLKASAKSTDQATTATKSYTKANGEAVKSVGGVSKSVDNLVKSFGSLKNTKIGGEISSGFKDIANSASSALGPFRGVGDQLVAMVSKLGPVGLGLAAVTVGMGVAIGKAIEMADNLTDLSDAIGLNTDDLQFYDNVLKQNGSSINKFQGSLLNLSAKIESNDDALKNLGVATQEINGDFRNTSDVLKDVLYKLAAETDVTKRSAEAKKIFGKQAGAVNAIVSAGTVAIDDLYKSQKNYIGMSAEMVNNAKVIKSAMEGLGLAVTKTWNSFLAIPIKTISDRLKMMKDMTTVTKELAALDYTATQDQSGVLAYAAEQRAKNVALTQEELDLIAQLSAETLVLKGNNKGLYDLEDLRYEQAIRGVTQQSLLTAQLAKHLENEKKIKADLAKIDADKAKAAEAERKRIAEEKEKERLTEIAKTWDGLSKSVANYNIRMNGVMDTTAKTIADIKNSGLLDILTRLKTDEILPTEDVVGKLTDMINSGKTDVGILNGILFSADKKTNEDIRAFINSVIFKTNKAIKSERSNVESLFNSVLGGGDRTKKFKYAPYDALIQQLQDVNTAASQAKREVEDVGAYLTGTSIVRTYKSGKTETVTAEQATKQKLIDIDRQANEERMSLNTNFYAQQASTYIGYTNQIMSASSDVASVLNSNKQKEVDIWYAAEKAKLDSSIMSNKKRTFAEAELEKQKQNKMKVLWEKEKKWKTALTLINTAAGIANAWASGTWVENIIESAVVAATGVAQVAAIQAQHFAGGGVVGGFMGATGGPDNTTVVARKGEMFLNGSEQRNMFNAIKGNKLGGQSSPIITQGDIIIQGNANKSTVDQIRAEQNRFSVLIRDTVKDLQYRKQI